MVFVVVGLEVLAADGHLAEDAVLLEVAVFVAVKYVDGEVAEAAGYLKLELLPEEWTGKREKA